MAMKKRYHTVNGMLIGETTNGVRRGYLPDALGSVVATVDSNGAIENTYRYKPYGSLLAKTGTGEDPRFMWVGTLTYRSTRNAHSEYYVRHRHFQSASGSWSTADPRWLWVAPYVYCGNRLTTVTDRSGLRPSPIDGAVTSVRMKDCGWTFFGTHWLLVGKNRYAEGTIIQWVKLKGAAHKCDWSKAWTYEKEYLEAWQVVASNGSDSKIEPQDYDYYTFDGHEDCTAGVLNWSAKVSFYEGYTASIPPWVISGGGHPAGGLLIIDPITPWIWPVIGGPPLQPHTLKASWNCCVSPADLHAKGFFGGLPVPFDQWGGRPNPNCKVCPPPGGSIG